MYQFSLVCPALHYVGWLCSRCCVWLHCLFCITRLAQEFLPIEGSTEYTSTWVSSNWDRWCAFLSDAAFPASSMIISTKAQKARARLRAREGSDTSPRPFEVNEFTCSTLALVALLTRWSTVLKGDGRSTARTFLDAFVAQCLEGHTCEVWWYATSSSPLVSLLAVPSLQEAARPIAVRGLDVKVTDLVAALPPTSSRSMRRTLVEGA